MDCEYSEGYHDWQRKEREADEDYAAGRYEEFDSMEDFIASLDEPRPIVRSYDTDPMAKIGRLALPWTTLGLLIVHIGAVFVAFGKIAAAVVTLLAAGALIGRWVYRTVVGYPRGRNRR